MSRTEQGTRIGVRETVRGREKFRVAGVRDEVENTREPAEAGL